MGELFQESEFTDAFQELDEPHVDGWEFFTESHGLKIYRKLNQTSGLYQYKVYGTLTEIDAETCSQVYMDLDYRKTWDSYVYELYEKEVSGKKLIYWSVKFPKPMSYRDQSVTYFHHMDAWRKWKPHNLIIASLLPLDPSQKTMKYVYKRELRTFEKDGKDVYVILAQSIQDKENFSEKWMTIRVEDYHQTVAFTNDPSGGVQVFMQYYDDPKGMIPTWLVNWASKTAVPAFLDQMKSSCQKYPDYLKTKNK